MTFRRVLVSLAAVCSLGACSDDDTIVSLNVSAGDEVPVVSELHVKITQGTRTYEHEFAPPLDTPTGEGAPPPSIKNSFFQRLSLPDSFEESKALVEVEAMQENGSPFVPPLRDDVTVTIRPEGVVAAYVSLKIAAEPEPEPMGEGGATGAAGAAGASTGAAGDDGAAGASASAGAGGVGGAGSTEPVVVGAAGEGGAGSGS